MKLCRYGRNGFENLASSTRKVSCAIFPSDLEYRPGAISQRGLADSADSPGSLPLVRGNPRFGVPYTGISKFVLSD